MLDRTSRVVIDTNIWVSAFIQMNGAPARILIAAALRKFQIIASAAMLNELERVLARRHIVRRLQADANYIDLLVGVLQRRVELVEISGRLRVSRDPKDDMVIETAISGRASYLVSRDEDFTRDMSTIAYLRGAGVEVLTVAQFLRLLESDAE